MNSTYRYCFLILCFCGLFVQADETPLSAKLSQKYKGYLQPIETYTDYNESAELSFRKVYEPSFWKFVLAPLVSVNVPNSVGGASRDYAFLVDAQEAWVGTDFSFLSFSAGYQQISWGAADVVNPTDIWNPRDYTDLISQKKLSQLTIQSILHPEGFHNIDFQFLYSPLFRNPQLPLTLSDGTRAFSPSDSRWLLSLPTHILTNNLNLSLSYEVQKPQYAQQGDYGLRIRIPSVFSWDFGLYAFNGLERLPRFSFEELGSASTSSLPITVSVKPSFHRQTMTGMDAAGFIGDSEIGIRFESAYVWRDNSFATKANGSEDPALIRNDFMQSVLSIDRSFSKNEFSYLDYINLSYVHYDETTNRRESQNTSYLPNIEATQPWNRTLALLLKEEVFEHWSLKGTYLYEMANDSSYFSPSLLTDWTDNLSSEIGLDLLQGTSNTFFGQYQDNSRFFANIFYLF